MDPETIAVPERSARGLPRDVSPSSTSPSSCRTYSIDSCSSVSTKPSSRGSSPSVKKESSSSARGRSRRNPQHAAPSWNLMFHPRSYEEICTERLYLLSSLQIQSARAVDMIHHYSLVEEELHAKEHIGKQRRKLRKQMSFIKVKLAEASRQEKAIIIRLSELQMEQLGRDAWDQVQQRRMCYSAFPSSTPTLSSTPRETPLSASSKEFVPSAIRLDNLPTHSQSRTLEMDKSKTLDTVVEAKEGEEEDDDQLAKDSEKEAKAEAESDTESEDLCNHGLQYTYQASVNTAETSRLRPANVRERLSSCAEEKRMSLPSLCSVWPSA
ncbi:hypothetical protein ACHAQJ_004230 [Trichoderma viride]